MEYIDSYNQLLKNDKFVIRIKNYLKDLYINNLSTEKFNNQKEYIMFPFWHHVFQDEVKNFILQIKLMKNYGDFISYDDAISLLKNGIKKNDKYFCLSFDDGFKNIIENVTDILVKYNIPCLFFIPTSFIDNDRSDEGDIFFGNKKISIRFLDWNDCKEISNNKLFQFGSHSVNHQILSKLSYNECYNEIYNSKKIIEKKLNLKCNHFAPPVGIFSRRRDIKIVRNLNYKSLSTTQRGMMNNTFKDHYLIKRHHLLGNWNINYLKYFFNK